MSDIECPYCKTQNEVCHDDGEGIEENVNHEMQCMECEKCFVFSTCIDFTYSPEQADCLNGAPHKLSSTHTYPVEFTRMKCSDCDYERKPTEEEWFDIIPILP